MVVEGHGCHIDDDTTFEAWCSVSSPSGWTLGRECV
jgi:hypothetical protein